LSTASITYPGLGTRAPGDVVVTTEPIAGILGSTTNPSPPANVRLFPVGTSLQVGALTAGGSATFTTGGVTFAFPTIDVSTGQYRAFSTRNPTTSAASYSAMTWTVSP
jgi:hypothetical protein